MLIGLKDDNGKPWTWEQIEQGKGDFHDPLPVLLSVYQDRVPYADYSVTELEDDPYKVQLTRRYDYFESVDELHDRMIGTAFHAMMEKKNDAIDNSMEIWRERRMCIDVEVPQGKKKKVVKLGGTPDLTIKVEGKKNTVDLWDYKTVSMASVKRMVTHPNSSKICEWKMQLNRYRMMLKKQFGVNVQNMYVRAIVKDWRFSEFRSKGYNLDAYPKGCVVPIPKMTIKSIEDSTVERLIQHLAAERVSDERLHTVGECDTWYNNRDGHLRCRFYCPMGNICHFRRADKNKK